MKKLLIGLLLLISIGVIGLVVFLVTFNADRYRPQLIGELERALGRSVQLERIDLGWQKGIVIKLQGLAIEDQPGGTQPLIQVESALAVVELWPLLRKDVRISSVVLERPKVLIVRDAQGEVNLTGLAAIASPAAASGKEATVGNTSVAFGISSLYIKDAEVSFLDETTIPPFRLDMRAIDAVVRDIAPNRPMTIELSGELKDSPGKYQLASRLNLPNQSNQGSIENLHLEVSEFELTDILPAVPQDQVQLRGRLDLLFEVDVATLDSERWLEALSGKGRLKFEQAKIENLNILRTAFTKFSIIPGLVEKLQSQLPAEYQSKLTAKDTQLLPVDIEGDIKDGIVRFQDLDISTDSFRLAGSGRIGIDRFLSIDANLHVDPTLSAALIASVEELSGLVDEHGAISFPVAIQGQVPYIAVLPNMNYIASRTIVTKAIDVLSDLLKRETKPEQDEASQGEVESPESDFLGQLLMRVLKGEETSELQAQ